MLVALMERRWMMDNDNWAWLWMTLGVVLVILLWVAVLWALISIARRGNTTDRREASERGDHSASVDARHTLAQHDGHRAAEFILAERFARGELDADEYRHRLDVLRSVSQPSTPTPPPPPPAP